VEISFDNAPQARIKILSDGSNLSAHFSGETVCFSGLVLRLFFRKAMPLST